MQAMFDKSVKGLASQGFERSLHSDGVTCMYNGPDGTKHCAWGWVDTLPDDAEGSSVDELEVGLAVKLGPKQKQFARMLQRAHDGAGTPERMQKRLRDVAENYGLRLPKVLKEKK